jgi:hypothetical protein
MNQMLKVYAIIVLALFFCSLTQADESDLVWSTFVGGDAGDIGWDIAVGGNGEVYLTGSTNTEAFPTTAGAFDSTYNGGGDIFVAKLDPSGSSLIYSTLVGGDSYDMAKSIAVDGAGRAYVTGETYSTDFPTTNGAFDETHNAGKDVFVLRLNAVGSNLDFSTFLGGLEDDRGLGIAVSGAGAIYVTGQTYSRDFPTTEDAYDAAHNSGGDAFMAKLNATGSDLVYATVLGGNEDDSGRDIALDEFGNAHVTGYTMSADFPVTSGAFDTSHNGVEDVFVAKLDPTGGILSYATFLGGGGDDKGFGIALDGTGSAYVTGHTKSSDFPATADAFDTTLGGDVDLFVARLDASGRAMEYVTYLGGSRQDYGHDLALDGAGSALVTGYTRSNDFPVTASAFDGTHNGDWDLFVARLDVAGKTLDYGTFLGGSRFEKGFGIALDGAGNAYLTGYTWSADFPTTAGAYRSAYLGRFADAFVVKLKLGDNR